MTKFTSASNPVAAIAEKYLFPITKDLVEAITIANWYADFVLTGGIFPNYWHQKAIDWLEERETDKYPDHVNKKVTLAIVDLHNLMKPRQKPVEPPVDLEHLASPRPWTYCRQEGVGVLGSRDWIEDANGTPILWNVGHIDGPLICAAVNQRAKKDG